MVQKTSSNLIYMAQHLDLEEQEQLDQLKHFWSRYGNAITWLLTIVLLAYGGWNGYQYWQRHQAAQASALFDEVERQATTGDADKTARAFEEMKNRFPGTLYAYQAALVTAKAAVKAQANDSAISALTWLTQNSGDSGYGAVGRLRLAAVHLDQKNHDAALKTLAEAPVAAEFSALFAQRKAEILLDKGDVEGAKSAFSEAYKLADGSGASDLLQLLEIRLNALGVDPKGKAAVTSGEVAK